MSGQRCQTCYFYRFDPVEDNRRGSCRFDPPRMIHIPGPDGSIQVQAAFPTVGEDSWCGKWRNASDATLGAHGHGGP